MLGQTALTRLDEMRKHVGATIKERARLMEGLRSIPGVKAYPSVTNFILFRVKKGDADKVHAGLMRKGLVLRHLSRGPRGGELPQDYGRHPRSQRQTACRAGKTGRLSPSATLIEGTAAVAENGDQNWRGEKPQYSRASS